jgi:hypothetical protein
MEKNAGFADVVPPAGGGTSPWMSHFVIYGFAIAGELGFSTEAALTWLSVNLVGMVNDAENPFMVAVFQQPTAPSGNATFLQDWEDVHDESPATGINGQNRDSIGWDGPGNDQIIDLDHSHGLIAVCASSFITGETGGAAARAWLETNGYELVVTPETNPKWMILPRA